MDESPVLRRLRASNASLMNGNLSLLMEIRETDTKIHNEWRRLQSLCETLEQRGVPVPASCAALTSRAEVEAQEANVKRRRGSDEDGSTQDNAGGTTTGLSMTDVLNDD
ncbi:hypothetical protein PINS_up004060 [Pythium insidiosum]|nr:hypothetical protein PINS_up004060 [Pythium insidiosum]